MDRLFCALTICFCLCFAPIACGDETAKMDSPYAQRSLFALMYPQLLEDAPDAQQERKPQWYSAILDFMRGEVA